MVRLCNVLSSSYTAGFLTSLSLVWVPAHRAWSPRAELGTHWPQEMQVPRRCVLNRFFSIVHLPFHVCVAPLGYHVLILCTTRKVNQNRPKNVALLSCLLFLSDFPFFGTPLCQSLDDQCSQHVLISYNLQFWWTQREIHSLFKLMMKALNKAIPDSHLCTFLQADTLQFINNLSLWSCS